MREYFNAYHSTLQSIEPLDDAERGRLFTALLLYSATGETPPLPGNERFLFPALRGQIDRDRGRYAERCAQNRRNGALGGRPPRAKPTAPQTPPKTKAKEKAKAKTKATASPQEDAPSGKTEAEAFFEKNFGPLTPYLRGRIEHYRGLGIEEKLLLAALEEAARAGACAPLRYAEAILDGCRALGQKTLGEWAARRAGGRMPAPDTCGRYRPDPAAGCLGKPDLLADPRRIDYLPVFRLRGERGGEHGGKKDGEHGGGNGGEHGGERGG